MLSQLCAGSSGGLSKQAPSRDFRKNSQWTGVTSVEMSSRRGHAQIGDEDRLKIVNEEIDTLLEKWTKAVHCGRLIFWHETKSLSAPC